MRNQNGFRLWWCPVVVLALLVLAVPAVAQDHDHGQEGHAHADHEEHAHGEHEHEGHDHEAHDHGAMEHQEMSPEQQAEMQAWMEAMTPGEHHAHLAEMAGEWKLTVKMWEEPGGEPMVSEAVSSAEMMMGGRFLRERVEGSFMDMPFVGEGVTGYDNVTGEYWSTWIDSMTTGVMTARGNWDDEVGGIVMKGEYADPMSGDMKKSKSLLKSTEDGYMMEMWGEGPDGDMWKMMQITYTR